MRFDFPALFDRPDRILFPQLEPEEQIELVLRRHGFTNLPWIVATILLILVPFFIPKLVQLLGLNLAAVPGQILSGALILWYMLVLAYVIESFLSWYFNIFIVTNLHLINVGLNSLLNKNVTQNGLADVESVSSSVTGVFGELFNFGNVVVETAAEKLEINFQSVPQPDFVADRIQDLRSELPEENE
ncbi:PH domain-containing protein [Candidatus Daviesbacteria bacterium]|nr:PH domain-containing protein [Candidatus Daviesbacteria bacterium]